MCTMFDHLKRYNMWTSILFINSQYPCKNVSLDATLVQLKIDSWGKDSATKRVTTDIISVRNSWDALNDFIIWAAAASAPLPPPIYASFKLGGRKISPCLRLLLSAASHLTILFGAERKKYAFCQRSLPISLLHFDTWNRLIHLYRVFFFHWASP